jgi:hypothetical protein
MGACILYPCRISLPGLPALRVEREITGGDCSCPRVNKNNTHTHRPLSSQRACKNLFCQYIYLGERRLQNKGEGQTPVRTIEKNVSVTPSSAARSAFPSAAARLCRLPGYFFLASSSRPACLFSRVCVSVGGCAPQPRRPHVCIY